MSLSHSSCGTISKPFLIPRGNIVKQRAYIYAAIGISAYKIGIEIYIDAVDKFSC